MLTATIFASVFALAPADIIVHCDETDFSRCSAAIKKGEPSPFNGQILTTPLAIDLGQKAANCNDRIEIEVARTASTADVIRARDVMKLNIELHFVQKDRAAWKAEAERLNAKVAELEDPPFWKTQEFAVATTVILILGAAVTIDKLIDNN